MVLSRVDPSEAQAPAGFVHLPPIKPGDFNDAVGPWFLKADGKRLVGGFRVLPHMQNPMGVCHGGLIASFFDVYLSLAAMYEGAIAGLILPTVSLSLDFLAPTPGRAWVEARADLLRAGRRMAFVQGLMTVDGVPTARANGVFNVPRLDAAADPPTTLENLRRLLGTG